MSRRVVVTGLGAVTPIGNSVDDFWASDQMSAGVDTLKEQKAKLAEQKTQLESTLSSLNEQKSQLETIQSALSDFMNSDTYTKTIPSLKEGANAPGEAQ